MKMNVETRPFVSSLGTRTLRRNELMRTAFAFSVGGLAEATLPNFFLREPN